MSSLLILKRLLHLQGLDARSKGRWVEIECTAGEPKPKCTAHSLKDLFGDKLVGVNVARELCHLAVLEILSRVVGDIKLGPYSLRQ